MLVADDPALASALLLQSYPLHPPGRPGELRTAHLPNVRTPTLFVHGITDPFAAVDELDAARHLVAGRTGLLRIEAGHDLGWSGRRRDRALPEQIVAAFLELVDSA
jgi:predicted alpha/beta-hydrolase family hydrolase